MTDCGPGGSGNESCCTSLAVPGGTFYRTYDTTADTAAATTEPPDGGWPDLADPATVSSFRLDKYLVTVGRFRQFVAAWNNGHGWMPPAGSGRHAYLNAGQGLANSAGGFESGWDATNWNQYIDPTNDSLADEVCDPTYSQATWTPSPGTNENLPIDCVNWYEAYAFCIWDGGFLPSQAEWEYTAAGGSQQRAYPWGSVDPGSPCPGTGCEYAIYGCYYPGGPGICGLANIAPVGTASLGAGLWGQLDLAGEVSSWTLDWVPNWSGLGWPGDSYPDPCTDCADLAPSSRRALQGGAYDVSEEGLLVPASIASDTPADRNGGIGVRCARAP